MTLTDWIGTIGVTILLAAYFLNLVNVLKKESIVYPLLNIVGAGVACFASVLLKYMPFVILEASWMIVSAFGFINNFKQNKK